MVAQAGRDVLIKMDIDEAGNFQPVAGIRTSVLKFNAQSIEVTHIESENGWREILPSAGIKTVDVEGKGVFLSEETDRQLRQYFFEGRAPKCQLCVPALGLIEGRFQIASINYSGSYDGESLYEISLKSAGSVLFEAAE